MLLALIALLALAPTADSQPLSRRSVLLLLPDPPGRPNSSLALDGVQTTLRAADPSIALSTDYISQEGQGRPEFVATQLAWYREKYRNKNFDVIIVLGPQTLLSLLRVRDDLWPGVPIVFCGGGRDSLRGALSQPELTASLFTPEMPENLKVMKRILPGLRHIAMVGGASPVDRQYNARIPGMIHDFDASLDVIPLTELALPELKARAAALPPNTAVLIANYFYDPAGRPMFRQDLVSALAPVSNAPIFVPDDIAMGLGIVGGQLTHYTWIGARAAEIALRILRGEKASNIPVEVSRSASPQFDWRQLQRWGIPLDRLPAGSEVLYRPFSVWEHYWWVIVLAVIGAVLESLLVAVLIYERRRTREMETARQRAEREAVLARDEISHLNRVASMGELAASLAHELNQPLSAILSNAQAAERFLAQPQPDLLEVRDALKDIREDDTRASDIIRSMRQMVKKQSTKADAVDVNAVVTEALRLLRSDASLRGIAIEFRPSADLVPAFADAVQLRQVITNLVLNAMEAIHGQGRVVVQTQPGERAGEVAIAVSDSGPGVPPDLADRVFQPFFSTKPAGLGMGLSIISSIVAAHGGRMSLENRGTPECPGATFRITLPSAERTAAVVSCSNAD